MIAIFNGFKRHLRDILPKRYQVPAKYWFGYLRVKLEPEMKLLKYIVKSNDRVIDIGGNRGVYTYSLWRLGARVDVFEPNPKCCDILISWADSKSAVNVHSVALSSHQGFANLHIPIDSSGVEHDASASLEDSEFDRGRDESVSLKTLDSYRFKGVSLIKIDVEGHEYSVIYGAAETLTSERPALLVEIEQRHFDRPMSEVFERILEFGYQGFFLRAGKLLMLDNFDIARDQSMDSFNLSKECYVNNFLFLHSARLASGEYNNLVIHRFSK